LNTWEAERDQLPSGRLTPPAEMGVPSLFSIDKIISIPRLRPLGELI